MNKEEIDLVNQAILDINELVKKYSNSEEITKELTNCIAGLSAYNCYLYRQQKY